MKEGNSLIALPQQLVEGNIKAAEGKAAMPFWRMALLGVFAGMFIAGGAAKKQRSHACRGKRRAGPVYRRLYISCRTDDDSVYRR